MGLNLMAKVATKNLVNAMQNRDVSGMSMAIQHGADLSNMSAVFPHAPEVEFDHPLEIAIVCALPYEGFELLVRHGARVTNMDEGQDTVRQLFESMPPDIEKHWKDVHRIKQYLLTDLTANSEPVEAPPTVLQAASTTVASTIGKGTQAVSGVAEKTKSSVGGLFGKFKRS